MIRTLHLCYTYPYPQRSGYDLRATQIPRHLGNDFESTLLTRSLELLSPDEPFHPDGLNIDNLYLPRPSLPEKIIKASTFIFSPYPVSGAGWYFKPYAQHLEFLLRNDLFDVVVVEGIWLSVYWPIIKKSKALKVLNHYDIETEKLVRQREVADSKLDRWFFAHAAERMERLERSILSEADLVLLTSEADRKKLAAKVPNANLHVAPNGVDTLTIRPIPLTDHPEILFVGSLKYFPNIDGIIYFANEVFPRVREKIPIATLRIVGRAPATEVLALDHLPGVVVEGEVESLEPFYQQAALTVVPLRAGGGTRLKILESMAYGRPVVSTSIGCEGLDVRHGEHLMIADEPADMADQVFNVLDNREKREQLAQAGRVLVESRYAWSQIGAEVGALLKRSLTEKNL